jgi:hypothetical protein
LVPLVDQKGQLGYVVFRTEYFDIYGFIVQQLGGALNTARLYRQATEGRRWPKKQSDEKPLFIGNQPRTTNTAQFNRRPQRDGDP